MLILIVFFAVTLAI